MSEEEKAPSVEEVPEATGDSETVMAEGLKDEVASGPVKPPPAEELEEAPEVLKEEPHSEEPVVEKAPTDVASNESFHFVSVGDSETAESKEKRTELYEVFAIWKERVVDLVFWRDIKVSAFVFVFSLLVLLSLRCFSVIAVFAYLSLALLTVTISFRLYKFVLQTINGTQQPNPFHHQPACIKMRRPSYESNRPLKMMVPLSLLDADVALSQQQILRYSEAILGHLNGIITTARDLLLVKNIASSLKFGLLMWLLTYVGSCFNGLTLLTLDLILAFTLPPVYEKYQTPIDTYYGLACTKVCNVYTLVMSKVPGGSKQKTQ